VETFDLEKDKHETDIAMVGWNGTEHVRLTASADSSERSPRWSPDNRYLAFIAARGDETQKKSGSQVWLLNRSGGEAQQLTNIKGGVSDLAWSPDGKRMALVLDDPDPNDEPEKIETWKRKTAPPIVIDRYQFKRDRSGYLRRLHSHLSLFDVESRKLQPLTTGNFDETLPAWSPDGRFIAFVSNRTPDPDRTNDTNIYVIEPKTGVEPRQLTTFAGSDGGRPAWSPDSQSIAYLQGEELQYAEYAENKLAVVSLKGGSPRVLTDSLDRPVRGDVAWSADGRSLFFTFDDDRAAYLGRIAAAGGPVERLTSGRQVVANISRRDDKTLALLQATSSTLDEVYAFENGALRPLTHENDAIFRQLELGVAEDFTSRSNDGTDVHGLLVKPPSFVPNRRYPALLLIHGGPNGQDAYRLALEPEFMTFARQFFAANGYLVLSVNYRGSSGRGAAYQKAIAADWGNKEVMDLLGAVDTLVASGIADPNRLGIGGWSYGGILTNYTIATDRRFKAAVSGAATGFPLSFYGVDQYIHQYDNEIGAPWKAIDPWLKISYPLLHADRIKTPTLFMGGEKDSNVPVIGGEQMYQALKSLNIDAQLVIYPGEFHNLTTPSYMRDRLQRVLAWFDKYLKTS
jgi:dipeptidyl aminopeptidase/acylaminoacyl peptidase